MEVVCQSENMGERGLIGSGRAKGVVERYDFGWDVDVNEDPVVLDLVDGNEDVVGCSEVEVLYVANVGDVGKAVGSHEACSVFLCEGRVHVSREESTSRGIGLNCSSLDHNRKFVKENMNSKSL